MTPNIYKGSPVDALLEELGAGTELGQVGSIVGGAGMGKSALLVHFALEAMLNQAQVLHVALDQNVDHVRSFYDELFGAGQRLDTGRIGQGALQSAERYRMIHSYRLADFSIGQLNNSLSMLSKVANFNPALIIIDGLKGPAGADIMANLFEIAATLNCRVWVSVPTNLEQATEGCALRLRLQSKASAVELAIIDASPERLLGVTLDADTLLVAGAEDDREGAVRQIKPHTCTLFSGGANGAEAAFGQVAEQYGMPEINFTFDGHKQGHSRGRTVLSDRELEAGDVSLLYVSKRLNRTYSQGSLIRRVLQTLWHMVSRSQTVFVIGVIQEDGTVRGGTGWSVELAKMWNKALWVFDQDRDGWFSWDGERWCSGVPVIDTVHFSGTGTRYLEENGQKAIEALFARSFV